MNEALRLMSLLRQAPCALWDVYDGWQCPHCQVLDLEGNGKDRTVRICVLCGQASTLRSSSDAFPTSSANVVGTSPALKPDTHLHEPPQFLPVIMGDSARANVQVLVQL